jgi:hypothetical protein
LPARGSKQAEERADALLVYPYLWPVPARSVDRNISECPDEKAGRLKELKLPAGIRNVWPRYQSEAVGGFAIRVPNGRFEKRSATRLRCEPQEIYERAAPTLRVDVRELGD